MRPPAGLRRVVWLALCAGGLTGCGTLRATVRAYDVGPAGISRPQLRLREALMRGDFPAALAWREDDALLRALTTATSAYYAAQFRRAGTLLDSAALLADDRVTASVSREGLALVTNDNARRYRPGRTERLFIAYYGMLSFARLDEWESAAVEARRIVSLLAQYESGRDAEERALHATMEYLAGAVFERAGRGDEATVAYRAARAMSSAVPDHTAGAAAGEGEMLVVLERGFVAHRVSGQVNVHVGGDEHRDRHRRARHDDDDDECDDWLAVAFPALRRTTRSWSGTARLRVDGRELEALRMGAVVDDASAADERRARVALMARATVRAAARYALTKTVKDKKGEVAGEIANLGAALLERADVRSWHLLPHEVQLFRLRVPAGARSVQVEIDDGGATRLVEVGSVSVRAGGVTFAPVRLWRDPARLPVIAAR